MAKNKIYTLEDVRQWRTLKKDELDLEKLKLRAEQDHMKRAIGRDIGKFFLYEGLILVGEKVLMSVLKSIFKSSQKNKEEETSSEESKES